MTDGPVDLYLIHVMKGKSGDYLNQKVFSLAANEYIPENIDMDYDDVFESENITDLEDTNPLKFIMDKVKSNGDWPSWADSYTKYVLVKRVIGSFKTE